MDQYVPFLLQAHTIKYILFPNMKLHLNTTTPVPYLDIKVIEDFASLIIKAEDGHIVYINHLILVAWSNISKQVLKDIPIVDFKDDVVILSNFSQWELKIFHDFVMKGVLPISDMDIINNKLSSEIDNVFLSFGVNLKAIVNYFLYGSKEDGVHLYPQFQCKIENTETISELLDIKTECDEYDVELKYEVSGPVITTSTKKRILKNKRNKIESDSEYEPNTIKKPKKKVKHKKALGAKKGNSKIEDDNSDSDYAPTKINSEPIDDIEYDSNDDVRETKIKNVPQIRGIRGNYSKMADHHYEFISHKRMLELQKRYENMFAIQIPAPDFTEKDYTEFTFPKPIEELKIIPNVLAKYVKVEFTPKFA